MRFGLVGTGPWAELAHAPGLAAAEGGLWDTGPHALSTLLATLGPVASLTAVPGQGDEVDLVARHESGQTSTTALTQVDRPEATVGGAR